MGTSTRHTHWILAVTTLLVASCGSKPEPEVAKGTEPVAVPAVASGADAAPAPAAVPAPEAVPPAQPALAIDAAAPAAVVADGGGRGQAALDRMAAVHLAVASAIDDHGGDCPALLVTLKRIVAELDGDIAAVRAAFADQAVAAEARPVLYEHAGFQQASMALVVALQPCLNGPDKVEIARLLDPVHRMMAALMPAP